MQEQERFQVALGCTADTLLEPQLGRRSSAQVAPTLGNAHSKGAVEEEVTVRDAPGGNVWVDSDAAESWRRTPGSADSLTDGPGGLKYFLCPESDSVDKAAEAAAPDQEQYHTVKQVLGAPLMTEPFQHLFICNFLHPQLYADLVASWPAPERFDKLKLAAEEFLKPTLETRFVTSLSDIAREGGGGVNSAWKRLHAVLNSPEFTEAILKRFGLQGTPVRKFDQRVLTHHAGFSIGVHADHPTKLCTFMLYFPTAEDQVHDYGTNTHTVAQYERAAETAGVYPREVFGRYPFLPNSAYLQRIGPTSYHSVSTIPELGVRRTLVLNWWGSKQKSSRG
eukprot:CAMPEP_0183817326 /NCGR_PEP_ID=MMETSP0803_2-20130417/60170_1 /TAXON_ID=195967 /ORGANISM="Crustomastix stigmata, Strain CCMP3273" /LENGTH=335 /DNA_ID=CAMNT_0026062205 /DNA_START=37 /DNA_END=1045 /DNA_ORIENTATION=+